MKHLKYLRYLLLHKWHVAIACIRLGIWYRALLHDWSKFRPSEWFPYADYFYGKFNTIAELATSIRVASLIGIPFAPRTKEDVAEEFDVAWNHHQKRNTHHWQYWLLTLDDGGTRPLPMPRNDMLEMIADWIGAGQAITGQLDVLEWYAKNRMVIQLDRDTRLAVEQILLSLDKYGFDTPIKWNPYNHVVQDHRDGTIQHNATNWVRGKNGMPIPWTPAIAESELKQPAFYIH